MTAAAGRISDNGIKLAVLASFLLLLSGGIARSLLLVEVGMLLFAAVSAVLVVASALGTGDTAAPGDANDHETGSEPGDPVSELDDELAPLVLVVGLLAVAGLLGGFAVVRMLGTFFLLAIGGVVTVTWVLGDDAALN